MFRAIRVRPAKRTTLNGQQQGLGIGFRKAAWDFYSFFDIIPPFCQHIPRRCFFIKFADVAATLFRNLLRSLAREKLPRQKLIGVS